MDQKQDEAKNLPPEYAHLSDQVKATQTRVQQIDKQIESLPPNSQPKPTLTPRGFVQPSRFDREKAEEALTQQKAELQNLTLAQVEQAVKGADQKTARQVKDQLREKLFPNPFTKKSVADRNAVRHEQKDIEASQDLMDSYFSRNQPALANESAEPVKAESKMELTSLSMRFSIPLEDGQISVKDDKNISMSARFSQSLSYTKSKEGANIGKGLEKTREPEPDKD